MSKKTEKILREIERFQGHDLPAHYLGYFDCFNRQLFYEAHDVLEDLWLADRRGVNGDFYKGLIQLAGAFVHVQKSRTGPAMALLRLSRANLKRYAPENERLELAVVAELIEAWLRKIEAEGASPASLASPPKLAVRLPA